MPFSQSYSDAGCGARKPLTLRWNTSSAGTITGPLSIYSGKEAISDPCPFRTGWSVPSIIGLLPHRSNPVPYFVA